MRLKVSSWIVGAFFLAAGSTPAIADPEMDQAIAEINEMVVGANKLARDVRFEESNIVSLIELWDEFSSFGDENDIDDTADTDFEAILTDPEYRRWAASHNLDADDWLRKSVRITIALYREQIMQSAAMMPQQQAQQIEMLEQQRKQLGEDTYQQLRASIETSRHYSASILEAARKLPQPTPSESLLLETYRDELAMKMSSEDEYSDYDEDREYEEYEENEDYQDQ